VRAALAVLLIYSRATAGAVLSGIPVNLRLHRIARSGPARRARQQAEDGLRERIAATAAAVPSARLLCVRLEDYVTREPRFAPYLFARTGTRTDAERDPAAMNGTVYAEAYFGTAAATDEVLRELAADAPGKWWARGSSWRATPYATWESDRPGHPIRWRPARSGRGPTVIRHRDTTDPPAWSLAESRTAFPTVMRWTSHSGYLTVPRRPLTRRMFRRP